MNGFDFLNKLKAHKEYLDFTVPSVYFNFHIQVPLCGGGFDKGLNVSFRLISIYICHDAQSCTTIY